MNRKTKNKWIWVFGVIALLIVLRIALPFIAKDYVNNTLSKLEGYNGSVEDIDINLYRGAYVIKEIEIVKRGNSIPVPFVDIKKIDLSVHWGALLKGSVVGEVIFERPVLNFAVAKGEAKQDGSEADWTETLKELIPLQINRFEINRGKINYKDFSTKPQIDIFIDSLNLLATNLSNVESKDSILPSTLKANGTSLGGGTLNVDARLNVLKQIPDLDLNLEFENVELTALNDFITAYTNTDVEEGTFNLYTEIVIDDGQLNGYVKPVIENLKIISWDKEEGNFFQKTWESIVAGVTELFKNHPKDQFATEVPLRGNLNNVDVGVWSSIWNTLKNAFIEAFSKQVDESVQFPVKKNNK